MAFVPLPKNTPAGTYRLRLLNDADGSVEFARRHAVEDVRLPQPVPQPPNIETPQVPKTPEQDRADAEAKRRLETEEGEKP